MGEGETITFAEAMALQKAKQMALEQAGTYVESYTKVQNYQLTAEEIQTITGGVLQVEVLEKTRTLVGDGLKHYVKIKATVTTDKVQELAQRIKGKNVAEEYRKLQDEYSRLAKEIETWKQLIAKTPSGAEREAALDQIREREKSFASAQKREQALYQRLFSGEEILTEATSQLSKKQAHKKILESFMQWIVAQGYRITHQKPGVNTSIKNPGRAIVTIRVSVAPTLEAKNRAVEAAEQLGGDTEALRQSSSKTVCGKDIGPRSAPAAFPVVLSQDSELQELFWEMVNRQVLEVRGVNANGAVLFEDFQKIAPQRVKMSSCSRGTPARASSTAHKKIFELRPASSDESPPVTPIFSLASPTLEESYPGLLSTIRTGRDSGASEEGIRELINKLDQALGRILDLSPKQISEIHAGCRPLPYMGPPSREQLRDKDLMRRYLKQLERAKAPLEKPCTALSQRDENIDVTQNRYRTPSQVFLLDQPVQAAFELELPLETITAIQDVQARVTLKAAPIKAE